MAGARARVATATSPGSPTPLGFFAEILRDESRAGLLLAIFTVGAVLWASLDAAGYVSVWVHATSSGAGVIRLPDSVHAWIDDGAMSLFFLVVGLELSRAFTHGELRDRRTALLPVAGAVGGMVGAALVYLAVAHGTATWRGYGVPTATDIAFAIAALAVLGRRVPSALRIFVLALAVVDDIGSLLILVIGYAGHVELIRLAVALAFAAVCVAFRLRRVMVTSWYLVAGLGCWLALVGSGVEPALAGVVVGLAVPPADAEASLLEHRLRPVVNALILPLFVLANVGVDLSSISLGGRAGSVFAGVTAARLLGKALGITIATVVAARLAGVRLPGGVRLVELAGAGALCGVGFTVPLLIAGKAFASAPRLLGASQLALLAGSLAAFLVGATLLAWSARARSARQ